MSGTHFSHGIQPEPEVRDRIATAALDLFAAKGYAGTSLREVCEKARTTKPMVYYYFGSKEGLYRAMLQEQVGKFARAVGRNVEPTGDARERLAAFARTYLTFFQENERHVAFLLREVFGLGAEMVRTFGTALDEGLTGRVREIINDGIKDGAFRPCDAGNSAVAVLGILNSFILRRILGAHPLDTDAAVAQVVDLYVDGLRAR